MEGDTLHLGGQEGERQPPAGAVRVDLSGKTVMPALIDGHNHIGLVNERDGSNSKANYTRDNLDDQLERYAYYGVAAALSMGLEADQELAYDLRDAVIPNAARFLTVGKGIAATPIARSARRASPGNSVRRENGTGRPAARQGTARARRAFRQDLGRRPEWRRPEAPAQRVSGHHRGSAQPTAWRCSPI